LHQLKKYESNVRKMGKKIKALRLYGIKALRRRAGGREQRAGSKGTELSNSPFEGG